MTDVFISYSRGDRSRAQKLVRIFKSEGWSVWWDRELLGGDAYDDVIERALEEARCVVVVWSEHSVRSNWVRAEASEGLSRGVLIPVLVDEVKLPLEFRRLQAISFVNTEISDDPRAGLVQAVKAALVKSKPSEDTQKPVNMVCANCGVLNVAPASMAGRKGSCRECGERMTVPSVEASPGDAPGASTAEANGKRLGLWVFAAVAVLALAAGLWWGLSGKPDGDEVVLDGEPADGSGGLEQLVGEEPGHELGQGGPKLAAHDLLASLWEQTPPDLDRLLDECRAVITTVSSSDTVTLESLARLGQERQGDAAWQQAVAEVARWVGAPPGDAQKFSEGVAQAHLRLDAFDVESARSTWAHVSGYLASAPELDELDQRIQGTEQQLRRVAAAQSALDEVTHIDQLAPLVQQAEALALELPAAAAHVGLARSSEESVSEWAQRARARQGELDLELGRAPALGSLPEAVSLLVRAGELVRLLAADQRSEQTSALLTAVNGPLNKLLDGPSWETCLAALRALDAGSEKELPPALSERSSSLRKAMLAALDEHAKQTHSRAELALLLKSAAEHLSIHPPGEDKQAVKALVQRLVAQLPNTAADGEEAMALCATHDAQWPVLPDEWLSEQVAAHMRSARTQAEEYERQLEALRLTGCSQLESLLEDDAESTFGQLLELSPEGSIYRTVGLLGEADSYYLAYRRKAFGHGSIRGKGIEQSLTELRAARRAYWAVLKEEAAKNCDGVASEAFSLYRLALLHADYAVYFGAVNNRDAREKELSAKAQCVSSLQLRFPKERSASGKLLVQLARDT